MTKAKQIAALAKPATFADLARDFLARPWLLESVSWGAVALSAGLAAVGVAGLVGMESTLAKLGTFVLVAGTVLTETAATRLPTHAERHWRANSKLKAAAVLAGFAVLTGWNLIAGHFGMVAIDRAGVADKREPLVAAAAATDSARTTAEEALAAFDAETERRSVSNAAALRGAFESGYVTASARAINGADAERETRRAGLAAAVSQTRAADRTAYAALAAAPTGRPDFELWAFAIVLELLKGALVWFASAAGAASAPLAARVADPRLLSPAARRQLKSECASMLARLRHMEAAAA